jgi:hypothetical protein
MSARPGFWSSIALIALLSLGFATPAHTLTMLVTPELSTGPGDALFCRIFNEGSTAITVTTQIVLPTGLVLDELEAVLAGQSEALVFTGGPVFARCRFIGGFNKNVVRASIDVFSGGRSIAVAPAE